MSATSDTPHSHSPSSPGKTAGEGLAADIAANLAFIRERIDAAAARAGRDPGAVRLMAVSKTRPPEAVQAALAAGQTLFGENRVQEAVDKIDAIAGLKSAELDTGGTVPEWHLIGHLQTNKARFIPERFAAVQSLDSIRLAEALEKHAANAGRVLEVYFQLNLDGEATKAGLRDEEELGKLIEAVAGCPNLSPRGLMAIPDPTLGEAATRGLYGRIREMLERVKTAYALGAAFNQLSLGMSHDFEWAVEEGATVVRVGTAIFGARP